MALISDCLIQMKKEEKLIFVASHLLENLDLYADRVLYLKDGVIVHQQSLEDSKTDYIKIELKPDEYKKLLKDFTLPDDHHYIANHLFCIPLVHMDIEGQKEWIERLLVYKGKELKIGPLGTVEYYEKYYLEA